MSILFTDFFNGNFIENRRFKKAVTYGCSAGDNRHLCRAVSLYRQIIYNFEMANIDGYYVNKYEFTETISQDDLLFFTSVYWKVAKRRILNKKIKIHEEKIKDEYNTRRILTISWKPS